MKRTMVLIFTMFCAGAVHADYFSCVLKVGLARKAVTADYHQTFTSVDLQGYHCAGSTDGHNVEAILYPPDSINDDSSARAADMGYVTVSMPGAICSCGIE